MISLIVGTTGVNDCWRKQLAKAIIASRPISIRHLGDDGDDFTANHDQCCHRRGDRFGPCYVSLSDISKACRGGRGGGSNTNINAVVVLDVNHGQSIERLA